MSTTHFPLNLFCLIWPCQYCFNHFSKRPNPNSNLSNATKRKLLDSFLQEVTGTGILIATSLIRPSLYCLIHYKLKKIQIQSVCYCYTKSMVDIESIPCVSGAIWVSMAVTSWRSESSNISLVVLDKLLFWFEFTWPLGEVNQAM